ncbi:isoprenyl transferase [Aquibacillus rhizosphaerae]|uniref:Isoprenyl transferase n=1 Tax=Aquibacillus rhizosphaerae TaxID=3051431 RepID=A0ABT7L1Y6_9BACI|nr:isoprenyl transferase [Aquibacillus sp. LR5S19]MDL4839862.1 isoprenyl transferase [Aquibacillus sp. LR5S19]
MSMKMPFMSNKQSKESFHYQEGNTPDHIAIIMDGNGRWAERRGMPRFAGHKEGLSALVKIVKVAVKCNVKALTLYAFSTENWKRPKTEVDFILKLPKQFLNIYLPELISNNVRIETIGDIDNLPDHTREAIQYAIDRTRHNDGLKLTIALNYGSRNEILNAMKEMLTDINEAKLSLDNLDEQQFSNYLYTAGMTEPDLLIRTGGEKRLSNFLLWQLAYTEFWFSDVLWPDFSEKEFLQALEEYRQRKRRYGGISESEITANNISQKSQKFS